MHDLVKDMDQLDLLMPQMLAQLPPMIATMQSMRLMILTMHSTMSGIFGQMDEQSSNATAMGRAFDTAKDDDSFYLSADIFKNKDFQRILNVFVSPDGKAARMLITQSGDPATPEGIARVDPIKSAAEEALKATPLEDAKIYLSGTAAMTKDIVDGSKYDLLIAGVAALCLYFHHHADDDAQFDCRLRNRRYRGAFPWRVLRSIRAGLAVSPRHAITLRGARDVGHRPFGGGV